MQAVLENPRHPEYGAATIPFPLSETEYEHSIEMLSELEAGDALNRDCLIREIKSGWAILKRLEGQTVNVDELDYLAKRLEGMEGESSQFQGMAAKLGLSDIKDLINLTFCCQQATVITDFEDLESAGRRHCMNLNGGCMAAEEYKKLDGRQEALNLILHTEGTVTPYGVVYDNGMQLTQEYDGRHFPGYHYEADILAVGLSSRQEPENTAQITWLYLPCPDLKIERGLRRAGISDLEDARVWYEDSDLPPAVEEVLELKQEDLRELNSLAAAIQKLSGDDRKKLEAVVEMAEPENAFQVRQLAENLELFDFTPGVHTPEEYGKYMIQESGHFDYDANLEPFYNYAGYGEQRMTEQYGEFSDLGYTAYRGFVSLEELMAGVQSEGFQMGGLS